MSAYDQEMDGALFVDLMKSFFDRGWVVGSSGGMAVSTADRLIYYSPSSVQKERLTPLDLFVFNQETLEIISRPKNLKIRESDCVPIFNLLLNDNEDTNCVIHTHSKYSNLLTQLLKGKNFFEIQNQEMIKGIIGTQSNKPLKNTDVLRVPIIENTEFEYMLLPQLKSVLKQQPECSAVLVRNHGVFVWGPTWQKTKIQLECYEYLFELACDMVKLNLL